MYIHSLDLIDSLWFYLKFSAIKKSWRSRKSKPEVVLFCLTSSVLHTGLNHNVNTVIFHSIQHLDLCMLCMVSVQVCFGFSGFDYISEYHNMHGPCFSMISHAADGWPHLRHPCAGISGCLSGLSIIPPAVEDTAGLSPALYSPPCPPLLAWSLWVFHPAMMALLHGLADGWPMTSYLGVDAVVYVSVWWSREWHLWSLWHTICLTHPSSYCREGNVLITWSFICKSTMTLTLSWYPSGTGLLLANAQASHLAIAGRALDSTHSYKQTSWPLFIVAPLQREVFTKANKHSSA